MLTPHLLVVPLAMSLTLAASQLVGNDSPMAEATGRSAGPGRTAITFAELLAELTGGFRQPPE